MAHSFALILISFFILFPLSNLVSSYRPGPDDKLFVCSALKNASTIYQNNVNLLLNEFYSQSSLQIYHNSSFGDSPENRVYGFYMCRGDLTLEDCHGCMINATDFGGRADCRGSISGLFSSEKCIFQYDNRSTYGEWRNSTIYDGRPLGNQIPNHLQFDQTLNSTLESIIEVASKTGFATREVNVDAGDDKKLYSMAQCTRDLVEVGVCRDCLRSQLAVIPRCCSGNEGAMLGVTKCQLKYDTTPFYNSNGKHITPTTYTFIFLFVFYKLCMLD